MDRFVATVSKHWCLVPLATSRRSKIKSKTIVLNRFGTAKKTYINEDFKMTSSEQTTHSNSNSPKQLTLRWWPAAVLVVAMVLIRKLPDLFESPSLGIFMLGFMGPAGLGILILLWWVVASRASWQEKIIGFVAVSMIGFVASSLCHFTMQGMSVMIFQIPFGFGAFAVPLILLANQPSLRLPVALISSVIGFGYWDEWHLIDVKT